MVKYGIGGRLGNQLFQFAADYTEAIKNNYEYYINKCPVDINKLSLKPISFCSDSEANRSCGLGESEECFNHDLIRQIYSPNKKEKTYVFNKYGDLSNTLFISVRRGDFYNLRDKFVCLTANFYKYAYSLLTKKPARILISSDDIMWCKDNLKNLDKNIQNEYIENEEPINIIYISSQCKHFIISNSTFSWWCAWLGEVNNGIILCPDHHYMPHFADNLDKIYYPDRWTKIQCYKFCEK